MMILLLSINETFISIRIPDLIQISTHTATDPNKVENFLSRYLRTLIFL